MNKVRSVLPVVLLSHLLATAPAVATSGDPPASANNPVALTPTDSQPPPAESPPLPLAESGPPPAAGPPATTEGREAEPLGVPNGLLSARPQRASESSESLLARADPRNNDIVRVGLALAVVLALLLLLRAVVRRMQRGWSRAGRPSGVLEILARYPLGRGHQLVILKWARRAVLVHQHGTSITTLSEMSDPDEVAQLLARIDAGSRRRGRSFGRLLDRYQSEQGHPGTASVPAEGDTDGDRGRRPHPPATGAGPRAHAGGARVRAASRNAGVTALMVVVFLTTPAMGQGSDVELTELNPIQLVEDAARTAGIDGGLSSALNILLLLTVLSLVPALLILCTCFTRIVIVLGLLRQALGTQGLPPSQVIVGLSLFVTFVVMAPTATRTWQEGIRPYADGEIKDYRVAWDRARQPIRDFMFDQIEATGNWSGVYLMLNYRGIDTSDPGSLTRADVDMLTLVPAYILSELKVSFLIGFRVYLPFLVIDMVIASMLISMGMLSCCRRCSSRCRSSYCCSCWWTDGSWSSAR